MANLTGIAVDPECIAVYNDFHMKSKYKFVTFTFSKDETRIIVDKTAPFDASYDDFVNAFPKNDARYAVINFDYHASDGSLRSKTVFVSWISEGASIRHKMMHAGSKINLKRALPGLSVELQADCAECLSESSMLSKVMEWTH